MRAGSHGPSTRRDIHDGRFGLFQLQPVRFNLTTHLGQKVVVNTGLRQSVAKAALGRLIWDPSMQVEPAEDRKIQTNLQSAFQRGIAQPVPLTDHQAREQDQLIIHLRPDRRSPKTTLKDG